MQIATLFANEHHNIIEMSVAVDDRGVTISATGPTSEVEHTWTPIETVKLLTLLMDSRITSEIDKKLS